MPSTLTENNPIILYDGTCGLCHGSVAFLLRHNAENALLFAPLQGETATLLRARHREIPANLESVVLIDHGRVFLRSKAFLHSARYLTWPYRAGYFFRFVPAGLLDWAYRIIANHRYRWFGQYDTCRIPTTSERAQLLP